MLRANAVTVNPQPGCGDCLLQHGQRLKTISNATVLSPDEKDLLSPNSFHHHVHNEVLLSTAIVLIQEPSGRYTECRALLDSGSQVSFISRACAARLNLELRRTHLHVEGVAASNVGMINHFTKIALGSLHDPAFSCETRAYLVPQVTGDLPSISFADAVHTWPHIQLLRLADPGYNLSRGIELLLGADCLPLIMRNELRTGIRGQPMAQATAFGWVLLGPLKLKVELLNQPEHEGQADDNSGNRRDDENPGSSSSRPSWFKLFDLRKHSHPGPCWLTKFSLFRSSHARLLQQDQQLDLTLNEPVTAYKSFQI